LKTKEQSPSALGRGPAFTTPFQSDAMPSGTFASEAGYAQRRGFGLAGRVRFNPGLGRTDPDFDVFEIMG
jgi:hypothetical protein